jgi:hypothetical protein
MSDSNRGVLAAFAGIAALLVATGAGAFYGSLYSPAKKQYATVGAQQPAAGTYNGVTESLPDIALIPDPVERAIANPEPKSGQDHEKRDLAAQESMAVWAFYMALFAGMTALITGVGTYFIATQVKLTRDAVSATNDATKAMIRQNDLIESVQRPWLDIDIVVHSIDLRGHCWLDFTISVKNVGTSLACDVMLSYEILFDAEIHEQAFKDFFDISAQKARYSFNSIAPGATANVRMQASNKWYVGIDDAAHSIALAMSCTYSTSKQSPRWEQVSRAVNIAVKNGSRVLPAFDRHDISGNEIIIIPITPMAHIWHFDKSALSVRETP